MNTGSLIAVFAALVLSASAKADNKQVIVFCAPELEGFTQNPQAYNDNFFEVFYLLTPDSPTSVMKFDICQDIDSCLQKPPSLNPFRFVGIDDGSTDTIKRVKIIAADSTPTGAVFEKDTTSVNATYTTPAGVVTKLTCGAAGAAVGPTK